MEWTDVEIIKVFILHVASSYFTFYIYFICLFGCPRSYLQHAMIFDLHGSVWDL